MKYLLALKLLFDHLKKSQNNFRLNMGVKPTLMNKNKKFNFKFDVN